MARKSIIWTAIILLFTAMLVAGFLGGQFADGNSGLPTKKINGIFNAPYSGGFEPLDNYYGALTGYISELGMGVWQMYSPYPELFNIEKTVYEGQECYYFEVTGEEHTSIEAHMTSPRIFLNDSHQDYLLNFSYYSAREKDYANRITVYTSADGREFTTAAVAAQVYNSADGEFVEAQAEISQSTKYIRFALKAYGNNGGGNGVYIKDISLAPKTPYNYDLPEISFEFGADQLKYTGAEVKPEFTVQCSEPGYRYAVDYMILDDGYNRDETTDLGGYKLLVTAYSADNEIIAADEIDFTVVKGEIADINVDYCMTDAGLLIHRADALDGAGNIVTDRAGAVSVERIDQYLMYVEFLESDFYSECHKYIEIDVNSQTLFQADPIQSFEYDGTAKEAVYQNLSGQDAYTEYYKNNIRLDGAPKNAGQYTARLIIGGLTVKEISLTVTPRSVTGITLNAVLNDRYFDGTDNFYGYDENTFAFAGLIEGDTSVKLTNVRLSGTTGKNYLVFDNAGLGANYVLDIGAVIERMYIEILPVTIGLSNNTDSNGQRILTVNDKQYDGNFEAEINLAGMAARYGGLENAPLSFDGAAQGDYIGADALRARFDSIYAGVRSIGLEITQSSYLDRYSAYVACGEALITAAIVTRKLDVVINESDISVLDKAYDASREAQIVINEVRFSGYIAADEGVLTGSGFSIAYEEADFANADAGEGKLVAVQGVRLVCNNPVYAQLLNSYEVNNFYLTGKITKAKVEILNQYFYLAAGETPLIATQPHGVGIWYDVFHTAENAQAGENETQGIIYNFNTTDYSGKFYMRVTVGAADKVNYFIDGVYGNFAVIELDVAATKASQTLSFNISASFRHTDGEVIYYLMAVGGRFTPAAVSTADGKPTNLTVRYELDQTGAVMTYAQGVYTARRAGDVIIRARQDGDENYFAAEEVQIRIRIVADELTAAIDSIGDVYQGDGLPSITGKVSFAGSQISGTFFASAGVLNAEQSQYMYRFKSAGSYLGEYDVAVNFAVKRGILRFSVSDIEKQYLQETDFFRYFSATLHKGGNIRAVAYEEYALLGVEWTLHNAEGAADAAALLPGIYAVGDGYEYYLTAYSLAYDVEITGEFELNVIKSKITVSLNESEKVYGQSPPQSLDFTVSGYYDQEDYLLIKELISVRPALRAETAPGIYVAEVFAAAPTGELAAKYDIITKNGFIRVVKAPINVVANDVSYVYGTGVGAVSFSLSGFFIEEDEEFFGRYVNLSHAVTSSSDAGSYTVTVTVSQSSDFYEFILTNGKYVVAPADLTGITLSDRTVIYDGRAHSLEVAYDVSAWAGLSVSYSAFDKKEPGKYAVSAVVSKPNYNNLTLNAVLTINAASVVSSGRTEQAIISYTDPNSKGFDPDMTLVLTKSADEDLINFFNGQLVNTKEKTESLMGAYYYFLTLDGQRQDVTGTMIVRLRLEGIDSDTNIRVVGIVNGQAIEISHSYINGYIVFDNFGASQFGIIKSAPIYTNNTAALILGAGVALVLLAVIYSVFISHRARERKAQKRCDRRHHKLT